MKTRLWVTIGLLVSLLCPSARTVTAGVVDLSVNSDWTADKRATFYSLDQGSRLVPLAWIEALTQESGKPFLDDSLARYGFLPSEDPKQNHNLPVGFIDVSTPAGETVGVNCAACHVREMTVGRSVFRADGGPANADFAALLTDLDQAMARIRASEDAFRVFAKAVLRARASDKESIEVLRTQFDIWFARYHAFVERSIPKSRLWGPARMDAISLIYNRIAGLDVGEPPTYLIPENIEVGNAPARYPFLWNAARQDLTQWTGFAANGNAFFALTRNLGEQYGVFGILHPQATSSTLTILNRNYVAENSANMAGLKLAEDLIRQIPSPVWPWPINGSLAAQGETVFNRSAERGGCIACHRVAPGERRVNAPESTFRTPIMDVGTDRRAWVVTLRKVDTGSMQGASIPGLVAPLAKHDAALKLLRSVVVGAIADNEAAVPLFAPADKIKGPKERIGAMASDELKLAAHATQAAVLASIGQGPPLPPPLVVNGYEARVLHGIWAAAPFLHNGSVPTLVELLKPAAERVRRFAVGPEFDPDTVGLAVAQPEHAFVLTTTGCDDVLSGDSDCGHEYGTRLSPAEKRALIEYLKTL